MNAIIENDSVAASVASTVSPTRPFYWSIRRELWEHRALWIAPLVAAGLILLSFIVGSLHLPGDMLINIGDKPPQALAAVGVVITLTMAIVTWFYCLDSLYSERRDRSILFWKSLPVSDVTTVTSKLFVASALAPSISFVIVIGTQLLILLVGSVIIAFAGGSAGALWSSVSVPQTFVVQLYSVFTQAIWFAPLLAWLIFVSAWVRRSPSLWAVLVPAGICLVEKLAFGSGYAFDALKSRFIAGFKDSAFAAPTVGGRLLDVIDPVGFFSSVDVWVGLAVAAALIAATVWMRRYREPL